MGNMDIEHSSPSQHRKRSSLKHNNIFPDVMSYEEYMLQKNKKLHFDTKAEEIEIVKEEEEKNKIKDPKVKIVKKNSLTTVQPKGVVLVEEQTEIVKEIDVKFDEKHNTNFESKRKQSIKDEFSLARDLLKAKIQEEDDDKGSDSN